MTKDVVSLYLNTAAQQSGKTKTAIAQEAGLAPNAVSMMCSGKMKVPMERVPALAQACGVHPAKLTKLVMREYHPEIWNVIWETVIQPFLGPKRHR